MRNLLACCQSVLAAAVLHTQAIAAQICIRMSTKSLQLVQMTDDMDDYLKRHHLWRGPVKRFHPG